MHFDKKMTYINLGGLGRVLLLSVEMRHIQRKIFKINPQKNKIRNLRALILFFLQDHKLQG